MNKKYRVEKDTMGEIRVPNDKYWGAQTQRSLEHFEVGNEKMPIELIYAFAIIKKSTAIANNDLGLLDQTYTDAIVQVCDEIARGDLDAHFPLAVWQTGSGTQTNMNVNEVIANRGNEILGEKILHPNDHVNKGQSSNDTFPTAMHIAAVIEIEDKLFTSLEALRDVLNDLSEKYNEIIKVGRTHLQDATPLTLGQEISAWVMMLDRSKSMLIQAVDYLKNLAIGGTAVGTGFEHIFRFC